MKIFGIPISAMTQNEVFQRLEYFLESEKGNHIATVNPEMLVAARRNPNFHQILKATNLNVADGKGIQLMSRGKILERTTGNDLTKQLLRLALKQNLKICFLGGEGDQCIRAAKRIKKKLNLEILSEPGGRIEKKGEWDMDNELLHRIRQFKPQILLVGLGHQKQEEWIQDHLEKLPSIRIAVGIGGVFAFLSGDIKRAPKWVQQLGMEWSWRLMKEPSRIGRIATAVFIFPSLVILDRMKRL